MTTGHLGEHNVHGVSSILGVLGGDCQHVPAVGGELVAEEAVGEVDLPHHVDEGEELAEEEVDGVPAVAPQVLLEISADTVHLLLSLLSL